MLFFSVSAFAQNVNIDSLRASQKAKTDSLRAVQKHRSDSLKLIREYRASKGYKDSVAAVRQHYSDSLKLMRQKHTDSLITERKRVSDSLLQIRRAYNDSIRANIDSMRAVQKIEIEKRRAERKAVTDSLNIVRAYRQSSQYKDSVATIRKNYTDSLKAERKAVSDSLRAIQVAATDSMRSEIQKQNAAMRASLDSMRAVRQVQMDSMAAVRKIRSDSLAQLREQRETAKKLKEKEKEEKKKLKFEIDMAQKKEEYSNETMRRKGWTLPRRVIQNTFTRYNYYFNANKKMEEAEGNMLRSNIDNYDSLIALFPFDPDKDSVKLKSDMDSILQKAAVGIQIHDPRAKWQADLYLLVGQAYYYKGDYQNAGSAFRQIIVEAEANKKDKDKKKDPDAPMTVSEKPKTGIAGLFEHESVKNDAMLWLVRTLVKSRKEGQAQTLLDILKNDQNFPEKLKGRLALEQANLDLNRDDFKNASEALAKVSEDKNTPKWQRLRAAYLTGQLYQNAGNLEQSNKYFDQAVALHPKLEMDFYAKKNKVFNTLKLDSDVSETKDVLNKMLTEDKYRPYFDQLYFSLAKAATVEGNSEETIDNLKKSIQYSQNNNRQKGISFSGLGDQYYKLRSYTEAKIAYDSAVLYLANTQDPISEFAANRAKALNEIATPAFLVQQQDSLLHLASLSEKEQWNIIRAYIKDYEKRMSDSAFLAENAQSANMSTSSFNKGGQTWYFSNPTLIQSGENVFKQKWGNRKLRDNWRRSTASTGLAGMDGSLSDEEETGFILPNEDSLYAAIPHTPAEIDSANKKLETALFLLGKAYYTHLNDFENARNTFDTLNKRYPDNKYGAEVLYTKYLIEMRENKPDLAAGINSELQRRFPESEWAKLLAKAETGGGKKINNKDMEISEHYDATYALLKKRAFTEVLQRIKEADSTFSNKGAFTKRYQLVKAIAIAGTGDFALADTTLSKFIAQNPNDSLTAWAQQVLTFVRNGGTSVAMEPEKEAAPEPTRAELPYVLKANEKHYVILIATADLRIFALRSGIMDYNSQKAGNEKILLTMTNFTPQQNLLLLKDFKDAGEAKKYITDIKKSRNLFQEYPKNDYTILYISETNYPLFMAKKNLKEYMDFVKK